MFGSTGVKVYAVVLGSCPVVKIHWQKNADHNKNLVLLMSVKFTLPY